MLDEKMIENAKKRNEQLVKENFDLKIQIKQNDTQSKEDICNLKKEKDDLFKQIYQVEAKFVQSQHQIRKH